MVRLDVYRFLYLLLFLGIIFGSTIKRCFPVKDIRSIILARVEMFFVDLGFLGSNNILVAKEEVHVYYCFRFSHRKFTF